MSDANAQEPTMEEILASIRRIISEDDAPAADAALAETAEPELEAPGPEPEPEPIELSEPEVEMEEDILELTDAIPPPAPSQALGDLDVFTREEPREAPPPPPPTRSYAPEPEEPEEDALISAPSSERAASYFGNLSRSLAMPSEGRTLEDLVSELVRPLLKEWLDAHLPSIVEAKVQAEVERVSRSRR